jgi:hypothetical protein
MNSQKLIRLIFQIVALAIFIFQASKSLNEYFQYAVVIEKSEAEIISIEKPFFHICLKDKFHYGTSEKEGYRTHSKFLSGMLENSTLPTWKGIDGNSSFEKLQAMLIENDFTEVTIDSQHKSIYVFYQGWCKKTVASDLTITTKDRELEIFILHRTTNANITTSMGPDSWIQLKSTSNTTFEYKRYEISYEVIDNTIHEGTSCTDYRKLKEDFGECNYRVFRDHIYEAYGCYPPWMSNTDGKVCELDQPTKNITFEQLDHIWKDLDSLTDGISIELMKKCKKPCYQVKVKWEEKTYFSNWKNHAVVRIVDNAEIVSVNKAVEQYNIFKLTVELGSALGLWLGKS